MKPPGAPPQRARLPEAVEPLSREASLLHSVNNQLSQDSLTSSGTSLVPVVLMVSNLSLLSPSSPPILLSTSLLCWLQVTSDPMQTEKQQPYTEVLIGSHNCIKTTSYNISLFLENSTFVSFYD